MTGVVQGRAIKAGLGFYGWLYRYGPFTRLRLFAAKKLISYYENEMLYLDFPGDKSQILARLRTGDRSIAVNAKNQLSPERAEGKRSKTSLPRQGLRTLIKIGSKRRHAHPLGPIGYSAN